LSLTLFPGDYWLNVTPVGEGGLFSDISETDGANCTGSPCGNDDTSFFWSPALNEFWTRQGADYSMGLIGRNCPSGTAQECGIDVISVDSTKQGHPVPLPPIAPWGVEDRSGQPGGVFTIQMTFTENVLSIAHASSTCGRVQTSIQGTTLTVNLSGVGSACNGTDVTVSVNDVADDFGNSLGTVSATFGLLLGDVDGDRAVAAADLAIVQQHLGQRTDATNFRSDVNNDGSIDGTDLGIVTRQQGTALPR